MSKANVVDSSGWLEYFADTEQAVFFAPAIENAKQLVVPVITIYEVFKKVMRERGEGAALQAVSLMQAGRVVDVDAALAMEAARYPLPLADSLIYAVAVRYGASVWTQDEHFKDLPNVRYCAKHNVRSR